MQNLRFCCIVFYFCLPQEEMNDGLPPIDVRYGRLTGNIVRQRQRNQVMSGLEKMADEAWKLGLKAWEKVRTYDAKKTELSSILEGKQEQCPPWVSIRGDELTKGDRMMFLTCGLAAGSSVTVVGTPRVAHNEYVPELARTRAGNPVVLVSQFKVKLQGLKSVVAEDPLKILHLNPRLRGINNVFNFGVED
ncbi:putative galectin, carbohydrate recognition domain-containing protein [Helianthus debilis subsp. tardiflorus]